MSANPETILKTVFGYDRFRPLQGEIIRNVLNKQDTLAIMPTGGGKSLCYQLPALIFPGLTIVVSPLISLMKDQVGQLAQLGVPAVFLNSSLTPEEYQADMARVRRQEVKLLYVAPEALLTTRMLGLFSAVNLDCLTIDEAHCISEWGHDFRPEYRQITAVRERFPTAVCLALTATATPRVREDIKKSLGLADAQEFIASFNRDNLLIEVRAKSDPLAQTIRFLRRFPNQSGIIYCFSRRQVDGLAEVLNQKGYSVRPYHAGLTDEARRENQELFQRDDVQIIVATIAFGMGINKPNVRFVVHYDLPKSIEGYYQEIGRAGRDGLTAHCLLLYNYGDIKKIRYFIDQKEGSERERAALLLNALLRFVESDLCRRRPLLAYFGETYPGANCGMCDICLAGEKPLVDITIPAQKFLSCVKRTGETFGAVHIVDVLLGARNQKVLKFAHQNLSTYGIGKEFTKRQWLYLVPQLVRQGYLVQEEKFGGLRLTPKAYDLFRGQEIVRGVLREEEPAQEARIVEQPGHDLQLFENLRQKRKELADAARVPPYVIFSDKTLMEIATYYPMTPADLLKVNGVGVAKLERYGRIVMDIVSDHCRKNNLVARPQELARIAPGLSPHAAKPRHVAVGEAYNDGLPVRELMERFGVQQATILDHLWHCISDGLSLRPTDEFLSLSTISPDQQAAVLAAFERIGTERLRPVFDELQGTVGYEDLKILRLHYLGMIGGCRDPAHSQ